MTHRHQTYIGIKCVAAEHMDEADAILAGIARGDPIKPSSGDPMGQGRAGYRVIYGDSYVSWSPASVFEVDYVPVPDADAPNILLATRAELDRLSAGGPLPDMITSGSLAHTPTEQETRNQALYIARDSGGGMFMTAEHIVARAAAIYHYLTTGETPPKVETAAPLPPASAPEPETVPHMGSIFGDELDKFGEHALAQMVRSGGDNSHAGAAATRAMVHVYRLGRDEGFGAGYEAARPLDPDLIYVGEPEEVSSLAELDSAPTFDISTPRDALARCRETFLAYGAHHSAKGTPEGTLKAQRNFELAAMCRRIIENDAEMKHLFPAPTNFRDDLAQCINRWSMESGSATPDFLLARYLSSALIAFEGATIERDKWYGRTTGDGPAPKEETTAMHGLETADAPMEGANFPLYSLRREVLDKALVLLTKMCTYGHVSSADDASEARRVCADIEAAIVERHTPPPNPGGGKAGFVIGSGFTGGDYGHGARPE
jgi:hypothetical protein